jgi:hypothetical protein
MGEDAVEVSITKYNFKKEFKNICDEKKISD